MSVRRSTRTRTATLLVGLTAASLTAGAAAAGGATAAPIATADGASLAAEPGSDAPSDGDSRPGQRTVGAWPAELTEHTRLFVNPYKSYLVEMRDGVPTLVLSTGFDSCWFMTRDGVLGYPC